MNSRNIHLDTTDTELDESTEHLATCDLVRSAAYSAFDEQGVVVGLTQEF